MKSKQWASMIVFATACKLLSFSSVILAQKTVTVRAVVTATTRLNEGMRTVPRKSVAVDLGRKPQEVFGWTPLRGPAACTSDRRFLERQLQPAVE